ncbi:MAG TPA: substrate-binding domain-containing protein [Solirubrobacteraceae bacterium]|nr:substrate-binding domain-containing protein [Solirubrobacteraceae bacterium]
MSRYIDIAERLLQAIADGALPPGAALPSVRALARREGTTPATAGRAYAELARAGVIVSAPRRVARVAPDGAARAHERLTGDRALRLAGSDDPLLDVLVAATGGDVERAGSAGSFSGLTALWRGRADAATLHLWHTRGYNAPYAARVLAGREPVLVHLWRREQGIVVPPGNPRGIGTVEDLGRVTTAHRAAGTGTRALVDRLLRERRRAPDSVRGPELDGHLDVGLAVAAGLADAGVAVRSAATTLGLDFVPLAWEPFALALPGDELGRATALLSGLASERVGRSAAVMGGYDLAGTGRAEPAASRA